MKNLAFIIALIISFSFSVSSSFSTNSYHVDHIQALARGGAHHQDNLQYLPVSENCRKCADREYDKSKAIDWRTIVKLE
jgi:hypothetical protein